MNEQQRQAFLAEPHVGVLSVAGDDGRPPLTIPLWYACAPGGVLTFFTGTQGRKACKTALIERAGAVNFCVQRAEFPYKHVTVQGAVIGADRPPSDEGMLAIVRRYLPEEQAQGFVAAELAQPSPMLVLFTIRPERWLAADFGEAAG